MPTQPHARILFVDDEPNILKGLQRTLRPYKNYWQMRFAQGGKEALDLMADQDVDIIFTDMRMPGMDGTQLLEQVWKKQPDAIRIILSGQSDEEQLLRTLSTTHQYLAKPCEKKTLVAVLKNVSKLTDLIPKGPIKTQLNRMHALPAMPDNITHLHQALKSRDLSLLKLKKIIATDLAMSAKILQLVNFSFFNTPGFITDIEDAIGYLGANVIHILVNNNRLYATDVLTHQRILWLKTIHHHCLETEQKAKSLVIQQGLSKNQTDEIAMAARFHDIGKIILAVSFPKDYDRVIKLTEKESAPFFEAEKEIFNLTHSEIGAYLLGLWGMPEPVVAAVAEHHLPTPDSIHAKTLKQANRYQPGRRKQNSH